MILSFTATLTRRRDNKIMGVYLTMKYIFTDETREFMVSEKTTVLLHRIQAAEDNPVYGVKYGDLGGWIKSEANLSQDGFCWVDDEAQVFGNACVYGHARVYGNARIDGNARIYDYAWIGGNAWVSESAQVYGHAQVCDGACICGNAQINGFARVFAYACLGSYSRISGHAMICGWHNLDTNKKVTKGIIW